MDKLDQAADLMDNLNVRREYSEAGLYLGTSAFIAAGWRGSFYPLGMPQREYLTYYAQIFRTVELDSTFYATPSPATVNRWYEKTPPDFVFAPKRVSLLKDGDLIRRIPHRKSEEWLRLAPQFHRLLRTKKFFWIAILNSMNLSIGCTCSAKNSVHWFCSSHISAEHSSTL